MLKLNIKLNSIRLSNEIVHPNDTIRVSITTIPDKQKDAKLFEVKNIDTATPTFRIKMKDSIQKILIVFRKKSFFFNDPIIASTIIHRNEIGVFDDDVDCDYKKFDIYEPAGNNNNHSRNRRVVGSMEASFSLKEELQHVHVVVKKDDGKSYSSLRAFFNDNENQNVSYM